MSGVHVVAAMTKDPAWDDQASIDVTCNSGRVVTGKWLRRDGGNIFLSMTGVLTAAVSVVNVAAIESITYRQLPPVAE